MAEAVLGEHAAGALRDGRRLGFLVPSEQGIDEIHPLLRAFLEEKFRELAGDRAPQIVELVVRHILPGGGMTRPRSSSASSTQICSWRSSRRRARGAARGAATDARPLGRVRRSARGRCTGVRPREGELAFRAADRTRSEALGLQAARRFEEGHPLLSRSFALAGASAHQASHGLTALDYYGRAEDVALTPADHRQAVWGRFSMVALEREDGAAQALRELEDMKDTSADGVLRAANGRLMLATLRGDIRASVDEMTIKQRLPRRQQTK